MEPARARSEISMSMAERYRAAVMLRPMSALVPFAQAMAERAHAAGLQIARA
jgi:hypothetical protein